MTKIRFGIWLVCLSVLAAITVSGQDKKLKPLDQTASSEKSVSWLRAALKDNSSHIFRSNYGGTNVTTVRFNFKPIEFEGCSVEYEFSKSLLETERRAVYRAYDSPNPASGISKDGAFISAEFKSNRNDPMPNRAVTSVDSVSNLSPDDGKPEFTVSRPYLKKTVLGQVRIDLTQIDETKIFVRKDDETGSFVLVLPLVNENFVNNKGLTVKTRDILGEHFFNDEQTANIIKEGFLRTINACRNGK